MMPTLQTKHFQIGRKDLNFTKNAFIEINRILSSNKLQFIYLEKNKHF